MVKNSPANPGGHGFDPWSGKISHASEQLSLYASTMKPVCLEAMICDKNSHCKRSPNNAAREGQHSNKDPTQPKIDKRINKTV